MSRLSEKYPNKRLLIVLDNLWPHKTCLIIKIMSNYPKASLLFVPSCTP